MRSHRDDLVVRRILAVCTSHIGGVLLITPALELLRRFFPPAEISVLVRKGTETMLLNNPVIKQIYTDGEITSNQRLHERTRSSLGQRLRQVPAGLTLVRRLRQEAFDLVVDFTGSDRGAILGFLSGARERVCYTPGGRSALKRWMFTESFPRPEAQTHKVLENAELVFRLATVARFHARSLPEKPPVGALVMKPSAEDLAWAEQQWQAVAGGRLRVLIHPTSRVAYKCWAPDKWARLMAGLQTDFEPSLLVTSSPDPKEVEMARSIVEQSAAKPKALLGELTLGKLAALIQRADLFLGVDSAPMHMAAAVGTRVVAIFGPSFDAVWGPWGKGHRVLRHACPCLESRERRCSEEKGFECLREVSDDEVYRAVREAIDELQMAGR